MEIVCRAGIQMTGDGAREVHDDIIVEDHVRLFLNGEFLTALVASPDRLDDLGAGFVVCEGLADSVESVEVAGKDVHITAPVKKEIRLETESSGGSRVLGEPGSVASSITITADGIRAVTAAIESDTWRRTGGVHCSVLFCDGELVTRACDVGRHNTVDKVVGHAALKGLDRSRCILGCTGRQPAGMVAKAANAGIPIVVSRAATTDRGILTAERAGLTLVGFSRGERFTIYTHPERVPEVLEQLEKTKR
ncbi:MULTISPECIES: formate dehydrogenase accessory sulfurtransferase FdhD [Methanoculleus]|uniref:Protein FdhD n=2 Tax=Methanoculleus TaxID=45989 RepID=A3CWT7_METMJ|nr:MULTISPECIES: formate dehydrogenase accessory sulfurtransferase FdhD [Methanoculleus]ABN57837.1 formate dehydrogenase family accessory protein FdhD [Methanoculleus marisnigri JR1]MCC7555124.1 formate dehydrogenase accessory sulfurtransferase FdhD [Methanoculleus marisnigri]UYU19225.1 formate dehydrogenase accessory sulfurtransferase FdhD [Methanoculleus submarinus]